MVCVTDSSSAQHGLAFISFFYFRAILENSDCSVDGAGFFAPFRLGAPRWFRATLPRWTALTAKESLQGGWDGRSRVAILLPAPTAAEGHLLGKARCPTDR